MKRSFVRISVSIVTMFALAACGGGSASDDSSRQAGDASSVNTAEAVDDESGIVQGGDCLSAATAFNAVNYDIIRALPSPENLDLDRLTKNIATAKAVVPAAIATEFALFADTYAEVGKVLSTMSGSGGVANPANAAQLEELTQKLENEDFGRAMDRLGNFFKSECLPS